MVQTLSSENQTNIAATFQDYDILVEVSALSLLWSTNARSGYVTILETVTAVEQEIDPLGGLARQSDFRVVFIEDADITFVQANELDNQTIEVFLQFGTDAKITLIKGKVDNWRFESSRLTLFCTADYTLRDNELPTVRLVEGTTPIRNVGRYHPITFGSHDRALVLMTNTAVPSADPSTDGQKVQLNTSVAPHTSVKAFRDLLVYLDSLDVYAPVNTSETGAPTLTVSTAGILTIERGTGETEASRGRLEFVVTVVPLRVTTESTGVTGWQNPANTIDEDVETAGTVEDVSSTNQSNTITLRALLPGIGLPETAYVVDRTRGLTLLCIVTRSPAMNDGARTEELLRAALELTEGVFPSGSQTIFDGWSLAQNAAAPENGGVTLEDSASQAFSNLEDATTEATTYTATFDIDSTAVPGGQNAIVSLYYNDGPGSTNWTLADSQSYQGSDLTDETLEVTSVALGPNYDLRITLTYDFSPTEMELATLDLHGEDHATEPGVQFVRVSGTESLLVVVLDDGETAFDNLNALTDGVTDKPFSVPDYTEQLGVDTDGDAAADILPARVIGGRNLVLQYVEEDLSDANELLTLWEIRLRMVVSDIAAQLDLYADLDGYADTGAGTYTGTSQALVENPADVVHMLLGGVLGFSNLDTTGLAAARSAIAGFKVAGQVTERMTAAAVLDAIAREGKLRVFLNADDDYSAKAFAVNATVDRTLSQDDGDFATLEGAGDEILEVTLTGLDELYNQFEILYKYDIRRDGFDRVLSVDENTEGPVGDWLSASQARYNVTRKLTVEARWIRDENTATSYLHYLIHLLAERKRKVVFQAGPNTADLEIGDVVQLDHVDLYRTEDAVMPCGYRLGSPLATVVCGATDPNTGAVYLSGATVELFEPRHRYEIVKRFVDPMDGIFIYSGRQNDVSLPPLPEPF